ILCRSRVSVTRAISPGIKQKLQRRERKAGSYTLLSGPGCPITTRLKFHCVACLIVTYSPEALHACVVRNDKLIVGAVHHRAKQQGAGARVDEEIIRRVELDHEGILGPTRVAHRLSALYLCHLALQIKSALRNHPIVSRGARRQSHLQ